MKKDREPTNILPLNNKPPKRRRRTRRRTKTKPPTSFTQSLSTQDTTTIDSIYNTVQNIYAMILQLKSERYQIAPSPTTTSSMASLSTSNNEDEQHGNNILTKSNKNAFLPYNNLRTDKNGINTITIQKYNFVSDSDESTKQPTEHDANTPNLQQHLHEQTATLQKNLVFPPNKITLSGKNPSKINFANVNQ